MTGEPKRFIFTLTSGRTGTAYLAELLRASLIDAEVHHEILGYDAFGNDLPDISHLNQFNARGNTQHVQAFWRRKLGRIAANLVKYYVETSHVLMKAGLVENLEPLREVGVVDLIVLKRDMFDTVISYRNRFDFLNKGNMWLWYLDPDYPRNIIDPSALQKMGLNEMGLNGICLWYICEITARVEYYRFLLKDDPVVNFHDVQLDSLSEPGPVVDFLERLGAPREAQEIVLPPPANRSRFKVTLGEDELRRLRRVIDTMTFDPCALARAYIDSGRRLGGKAT